MSLYFSGTYAEDFVAPIPGFPCFTGLFVTTNKYVKAYKIPSDYVGLTSKEELFPRYFQSGG